MAEPDGHARRRAAGDGGAVGDGRGPVEGVGRAAGDAAARRARRDVVAAEEDDADEVEAVEVTLLAASVAVWM